GVDEKRVQPDRGGVVHDAVRYPDRVVYRHQRVRPGRGLYRERGLVAVQRHRFWYRRHERHRPPGIGGGGRGDRQRRGTHRLAVQPGGREHRDVTDRWVAELGHEDREHVERDRRTHRLPGVHQLRYRRLHQRQLVHLRPRHHEQR